MKIKTALGYDIQEINYHLFETKDGFQKHYEKIVVVTPAYGYGLPKFVKQFLKSHSFDTDYLAAAVTFGSSPGGALNSLKRILKRRHIKVDHFKRIRSVENYMPIFGRRTVKKIETNIAAHQSNTDQFIAELQANAHSDVRGVHPLSAGVSTVFSAFTPVVAKLIRCSAKRCTKCGLCIKSCPAHAISMGIKKPKIRARSCNQCQRCLNICPTNALTMLRKTKNCPSYLNPEVSKQDLSID